MEDQATIKTLEQQALQMRKNLLKLANQTMIHIGGDLSVADIMTAIWLHAMRYQPENPKWADRDRFVLSKGHAAAVTSFCQAAKGCYEDAEIFKEYASDNGRFSMHSCNLINPHVEVSTGSLGHGLPVAGGLAMALKKKKLNQSRVYVVAGDGELQEGSMWEAAMSAAQFKLGNLIVFVDNNKLQFDGITAETMNVAPLREKWEAFSWKVLEIDGHDMGQLVHTIDNLPSPEGDVPVVVICNTTKGKGVHFMENVPEWHAGMLDAKMTETATAELDKAFTEKWGACVCLH